MQRKVEGAEVSSEIESGINSIRGGGRPLPESARNFFELKFGYSFSDVRVHNDSRAAETAKAVSARAYTLNNNIVFGSGEYRPETTEGKQLLAHELTHVVQQKNNSTKSKIDRWPREVLEEMAIEKGKKEETMKKPAICTPPAGITNSHCSPYWANSWWLPVAYANNATCACSSTPNTPTANCVRKNLQDRLVATPMSVKTYAASKKYLESSWNPINQLAYKKFVIDYLTPRIYWDHVAAYRDCCCPCGPADYWAWIGVTTVPISSCSAVGASIRWFGSCHCSPGSW